MVTKLPRFTFEKFPTANAVLTTQMKAVGEAMSIGRTFKESMQKALRSLETGRWGFGFDSKEPGEVSREQKIDFLNQLHLLSVPTVYAEPKGLFVLEALANGTPVVLPNHGSFPETVAKTEGGILVDPGSARHLAENIGQLLKDETKRHELGQTGKERVWQHYSDASTAEAALEVYRQFVEV